MRSSVFAGFEAALAPDVRAHCARRLVQSLHDQFGQRMRFEIMQREDREPPSDAAFSISCQDVIGCLQTMRISSIFRICRRSFKEQFICRPMTSD